MTANILRALQTNVAFLHDFRFRSRFLYRRLLRIPHEKDFNALPVSVNKEPVCLDIGANRGEAIQSILMRHNSNCKIVGFEPNPIVFGKLKDVYGNQKNVNLHNVGLGSKAVSLVLYIPFYKRWMFDGLASFKKSEAADWLKSRLWNYDKKHLTIREVTCEVKKLDDFEIPRPDFIKIDVQGFELEVLRGAAETIHTYKPTLLIETIGAEERKFLQKFGYDFYKYDISKGLVKGLGELNTYCMAN